MATEKWACPWCKDHDFGFRARFFGAGVMGMKCPSCGNRVRFRNWWRLPIYSVVLYFPLMALGIAGLFFLPFKYLMISVLAAGLVVQTVYVSVVGLEKLE